jgi:hypothetical protein
VHGHGVGSARAEPARGAQAQRQVHVLHVGEERLGEAADAVEGHAPVGRRAAAGADEVAVVERRVRVARALEAGKRGERAVQLDAVGVHRVPPRHDQQPCGHAHARVGAQRGHQALDEVRVALHVVVHEHDVLGGAGAYPGVDRAREAEVLLEADHQRGRETFRDQLGGAVLGAVVHHDRAVLHRLCGECLEAARDEIAPVPGRDDDLDVGPAHPAAGARASTYHCCVRNSPPSP